MKFQNTKNREFGKFWGMREGTNYTMNHNIKWHVLSKSNTEFKEQWNNVSKILNDNDLYFKILNPNKLLITLEAWCMNE